MEIYRLVGGSLGRVVEVDILKRMILIEIPCSKPLLFSFSLEFQDGKESQLMVEYLNLEGYCPLCYRMTHGVDRCYKAKKEVSVVTKDDKPKRTQKGRAHSYKGIVIGGTMPSTLDRDNEYKQRLNDAALHNKGKAIAVSTDHDLKEARNASKCSLSNDVFGDNSSQVQVFGEASSHGTPGMIGTNVADTSSAKKVRRPLFQGGEDDNQPQDQGDVSMADAQIRSPVTAVADDNEDANEMYDDDLLELEEEYEATDEEVAEAVEELRKAEIKAQEEEAPICLG